MAGASKTARTSAPPPQPGQFLAGQLDRVAGAGGGQGGLGTAQGRQALFEPGLQGAGDQPVARLDLIMLAHRPVGLEPGPLQCGLKGRHLLAVALLGVGHRVRGGLQRRRLQYLEQLLQHGTVQVDPADALTRWGAVKLGAAAAHIPGRVPAVPGVPDLHHPAAFAAAQQAGQQRRALAGGPAAVAAGGLVVGPQPGLDVLVGIPAQVAGMMTGDQHLPLVLRQLPVPGDLLPAGDLGPGGGLAEGERAGIGRVGQEVVDRGIGRLRPGDPAGAGLAAGQPQPPLPQRHHHLPG